MNELTIDDWGELITHPAFAGFGAKWVLRRWMQSFLDVDHESFIEPYCQTATVMLTRPRSPIEVINDLNDDVVNFFRVLREQKAELIRRIKLTPWAVAEFNLCWEPCDDPLERARRFYARSHMSIAKATTQQSNPGFRRQKKITKDGGAKMAVAAKTFQDTSHLWAIADRLIGVHIENDDALNIIKMYDKPTAVQFIDPPYPHHLRKRDDDYAEGCELSIADHEELLRVILSAESMILICSYRQAEGVQNELYLDMLADWEMHVTDTQSQRSKREECVWLNPQLVEARKQMHQKVQKEMYPLLHLGKGLL